MSKLLKIFQLGVTEEIDSWLAGKIRIVNTICFTTLIMLVTLITIDIVNSSNHILSIVFVFISFIMIIPIYLNYKKKHISSRILFLTSSYIFITLLAMTFGEKFHFQYYLVPGVGMSLIFFRDEIGKKKWLFTFIGIPIWIFLESWFNYNPPFFILEGKYFTFISYFSSFLIFITAIVMFGVFTYENDKQLKNINKMNIQLKDLANKDSLTKLHNRRFIDEQAEYLFNIAKRQNVFFAFCIFDIDFFKKVNDTYGHDAGDKVLKKISSLAKENLRESDLLGRIGGEEFCIGFVYKKKDNVIEALERFRKIIEEEIIQYEDKIVNITISLGVAYYSLKVNSFANLYKNADEALYQAKQTGRNRICEYKEK